MKMNKTLVTFFIISMTFGIFLAVGVSIYAVRNPYSTQNKASAEQSSTVSNFDPEQFYQSTCSSCHGNNFEGGNGPSLVGVSKHLSAEKIKNVLTNGKNAMPKGLVPDEHMQKMVKFIQSL